MTTPGHLRIAGYIVSEAPSSSGTADTFVAGPHHIETSTGDYLDLSAPAAADIRVESVARGLSHVCRFAGQCRTFYSVAEHACLVARRLQAQRAPRELVMAGLHHDDAEAFLGDVTRPLKGLIRDYPALEARVWEAVADALELAGAERAIDDPRVKAADDWALSAEAYYLLPSRGRGWFSDGLYDPSESLHWLGVAPAIAEARWLSLHEQLAREAGRVA